LLLTACGGGGGNPIVFPPAPTGLADVSTYLAQSVNPDGNQDTPLRDTDALTYRRADWAGNQLEDSFLTADGAITTWSYSPYGPFVAANGDGGEHEVVTNGIAAIVATQDGGTPGVQVFPIPWVVAANAADCAQGWTTWDSFNRGCVTTITYPATGFGLTSITAQTIVSEHGDPGVAVERIFQARGWGRLLWQAWRPTGTPVDPARWPGVTGTVPPPPGVLLDVRLNTNLVLAPGTLTGSQEWHQ
jgi:hypothetical protein